VIYNGWWRPLTRQTQRNALRPQDELQTKSQVASSDDDGRRGEPGDAEGGAHAAWNPRTTHVLAISAAHRAARPPSIKMD